jgi:hypothetical protein
MVQPRISAIEKPGYGNLNLSTLKALAAAFDVALVVRFAPFGELMRWSDTFSPDEFEVPSFDDEVEKTAPIENVVAFTLTVVGATSGPSMPTWGSDSKYLQQESASGAIAGTQQVIAQLRQVA